LSENRLGANDAITGRRKLLWRHRWPDAVRDDVLARLLALNAEPYKDEVNLGGTEQRGENWYESTSKRLSN
jgi:hypothetical protein